MNRIFHQKERAVRWPVRLHEALKGFMIRLALAASADCCAWPEHRKESAFMDQSAPVMIQPWWGGTFGRLWRSYWGCCSSFSPIAPSPPPPPPSRGAEPRPRWGFLLIKAFPCRLCMRMLALGKWWNTIPNTDPAFVKLIGELRSSLHPTSASEDSATSDRQTCYENRDGWWISRKPLRGAIKCSPLVCQNGETANADLRGKQRSRRTVASARERPKERKQLWGPVEKRKQLRGNGGALIAASLVPGASRRRQACAGGRTANEEGSSASSLTNICGWMGATSTSVQLLSSSYPIFFFGLNFKENMQI